MPRVGHTRMLGVLDGSSFWGVHYRSGLRGMGVVVRRHDRVWQRDGTPVAAAVADNVSELLNRYGAVAEFYVREAARHFDADMSDSRILLEAISDCRAAPVTADAPKRDINRHRSAGHNIYVIRPGR